MSIDTPPQVNKREFARVDTEIEARVRELNEEQEQALVDRLTVNPTVWTLSNETVLRDLASKRSPATEAMLAQAILELGEQFARLRSQLLGGERGKPATLLQLSEGGGRMRCPLEFSPGTRLELTLEDDDSGTPPVTALIEIVHNQQAEFQTHGFRFVTIHPHDHARVVRLIYQLQRRVLRQAHLDRLDD